MHPRNRFAERYDFPALQRTSPELARFIRSDPIGRDTIDFSDPAAVTALNRALLHHHYGISRWDLPAGFLCPPIPGRADYVHHLADLLADETTGEIPRGPEVAVFDVGVGANGVYPIIGACEYGWRFVGSEIDPESIHWVKHLVAAHPQLAGRIECRLQRSATAIFDGVVAAGERFSATMCNPPFHASPEEAQAGTLRKLRNLHGRKTAKPTLNFGGRGNELWCEGGEAAFVRRMIGESARRPDLCRWFTTLVAKRDSLPEVYRALKRVRAVDVRTIDVAHGQKRSRIVAWRFQRAT